MTRLNKIKFFLITCVLLFTISFSFGEIIVDNDYNFSLDIPEGYELAETSPDGLSYMFTHTGLPLTLVTKIYDDQGYMYAQQALSDTLGKLSASSEESSFAWSNVECSISAFTMYLDQEYEGWAVAVPLGSNAYLVLLCYSPSIYFDQCSDFIFSTLNSLCIDDFYYNTPGIITTFAYSPVSKKTFQSKIADRNINYTLDTIDKDGADFVINMEFRILVKYGDHPLMYEAWDRYYRMIYRDSYGRLQDFAKNVYNTLYPLAEETRPDNPAIQFAQYLLSWVQNFDYTRADDKKQSDFTSLPGILQGEGSDCDSRSLLICTVLEYAGIDSLLLVYPGYSHAIVAANIKAPGQTFINPENKEEYIMGETTVKVTWGTIAKEQADKTQCFSISFP